MDPLAQSLLPWALISLLPACVAAARGKLIFALQLGCVGLALSIGGWVWVLLFPDSVGMGIAYVLGPITLFGSPLFAVLGSVFVLMYRQGSQRQ